MVVFDADQIASPEFLLKVIPPFADPRVAWVQTPQRYSNLENPVARWANEQQAFFYDVICPERARVNAVPICGTNVAIRVSALESIGGFPHFSVTEDAAASLLLHPDWQGVYLAEYLAEGLGPMDIEGFFKQQRRWAVGMLELLFFHMHPTRSRLHPLQWVQYALSGVHYLRGLRDALLFFGPVVFLLTNYSAVTSVDIVSLGKHIFPLVLVSYLLVWFWLGGTMTWRTVLLGFGSFPIYTEALWKVLRRQRVGFEVTPKQKRAPSKNILLTHYLALLAGLAALLLGAMRPLTLPIIVTQLCILYGMMGLSSIVYLHIKTTTQQAPAPKESRDKETAACAL